MKDLTLLIPAKKEKESLPSVLNELKKFDLKILIVLEEEDVETINSIKDFNCEILIQNHKGYGSALIQGIDQISTKYFCIFNADGSFDPSELKSMYSLAEIEKFDLVFGTRYEDGAGSEDDTFVTYVGNKIFSLLGKIFFSLPITDILYTFVLGNTEKVKRLNLNKKDFSFCIELPIKARKAAYKLTTNVSYERKRIGGLKKVNAFKDGLKILISMISLYFI
jgi:glycosyltransferase involved in cell wall biosynthesis